MQIVGSQAELCFSGFDAACARVTFAAATSTLLPAVLIPVRVLWTPAWAPLPRFSVLQFFVSHR